MAREGSERGKEGKGRRDVERKRGNGIRTGAEGREGAAPLTQILGSAHV